MATIYGTTGNDTLNGTNTSDFIYGDLGSDTIYGGNGNDNLHGEEDDDYLYGESGTDDIYGGAGNDYMDGGSEADDMEGGDGNDTIIGGSGNDFLKGDAGDDNFNGGLGNDRIYGGNGTDIVNYGVNSTNFIVYHTHADFVTVRDTGTSGYGVDELYNGTETIVFNDITLSAADFSYEELGWGVAAPVYGTTSSNVIHGYNVPDTVYAGNGNDVLYGYLGDDFLYGEVGADTLRGGGGGDYLDGGSEADNMEGGDGNDTVIGGSGNDLLKGDAGDDTFDGGLGTDNIYGGDGADTVNYGVNSTNFVVYRTHADFITVRDTGTSGYGADKLYNGTETIVFSDITLSAADFLYEELGWGVAAPVYGTGVSNLMHGYNARDIMYGLGGTDDLKGYLGNDDLYGGDHNDDLFGGGGNDLLDGGTGADDMEGGTGNDTYVVDTAGDDVTELANEGMDTVQSGISYTLGASLENLTLTGAGNINGTGNGFDNLIIGNEGVNVLTGGGGDDYYHVFSASSSVVESAGQGMDTVRSYASTHTLNDYVERLVLTGDNALAGIGNSLDNLLDGNAQDNALSGMGGNDLLVGDAGEDTLTGGSGADTFSFKLSGAFDDVDVVTDFNAGDGDALRIVDLLYDYDPMTEALTDFVRISDSGSDSIVEIDLDGTAMSYGWGQIATLSGITGLTDEAALIVSGNLLIS